MLNYIWIGLIVAGILVAIGNDVNDEITGRYRNGRQWEAVMEIQKSPSPLREAWEGNLLVPVSQFEAVYGTAGNAGIRTGGMDIRQPVVVSNATGGSAVLVMTIGDSTPALWREMAKFAATRDRLTGKVRSFRPSADGQTATIQFVLEPIRFVKLKSITLAAMEYAATAVNIAIGLIGVMAFWLGVMKVAEQAGLLQSLTRMLTPFTRRLFPDVPPDHPAISAMLMNIAANMLGLSNAATPMGLKAMEELNKLNPRLGTATNAMCTFLAINTGGLILIPATAIAVRASVGSGEPGIIIGTSIFGAFCATVAGVAAAKLLQRLPRYRRSLEVPHD